MQRHLWKVSRYYSATEEEKKALWTTYHAATPAAYAGDAIERKALNHAERTMTQTLSARLLAIVRELLPPEKPSHR
jgi:hypothetical protein